ncbi:MAG TPA: ABC transporter substrate-binding protein [Pedococcus sp.]|nr:ABC transporter substrate-binding protein [Pedococcus sp.]
MRSIARALSLAAVATLLSSCGLLGDSEEPAINSDSTGPELTTVRIGVLPLADVAPIYRAIANGYFHAEGLNVRRDKDLVVCKSGGDCVSRLTGGTVEIAYSSWTPYLAAMSQGIDLRIVADATVLAERNSPVMVSPTSGINSLSQLAGRRIAITDKGTASHLLTASALKIAQVDPNGVQWISASFPEIPSLIMSGQVDAAYLTEPYTQMASRAGAIPIADTNSGPNIGFPLSGYATTSKIANQAPATIRAFQRALATATRELLVDRDLLNAVAGTYIKVSKVAGMGAPLTQVSPQESADVLNMAAVNGFRVGNVTPTGIGRVHRLMEEFGALERPVPDLASKILSYDAT